MAKSTALVEVSYHQYYIHGDTLITDKWTYTGFNGLVGVLDAEGEPCEAGEFAVVMTGTESGAVSVTVDVRPQAPAQVDTDSWDEIVEVSLRLVGTDPRVSTIDPGEGVQSLPGFDDAQPGPYRVRVHARGRDQGAEAQYIIVDDGDTPVEEHLITVWPAPVTDSVCHKLSDAYGAEIRANS